jgi:inositol phosphorylceramide mannosyltransferase catalytic subunit
MKSSFEVLDTELLSKNSKIIHQVWFGLIPNKKSAKKLFDKLEKYRNSWINKNPEFYYTCWNYEMCELLIKTHYPEFIPVYKGYKYLIQKCDSVRYFILHRYGGLYADMDFYCLQPWSKVIEEYPLDVYLVETPNKIGFNTVHVSNSLMYSAVQNHVYWKLLTIDLFTACKQPVYYGKHLTVMYSTGPAIVNRVYNNNKIRHKLGYYPYDKFHPFGVKTDMASLSGLTNVYAVHMSQGSWSGGDSDVLNFFYKEHKICLFIMFILIIPIIYSKFVLKKI